MMSWPGGNWIKALGRMVRRGAPQTGWAWRDRHAAYALWDGFYNNTIFDTIASGGQRENINAELGNAAAEDLAGLYNPVAQVVDLYLSVFAGAFGDEIRVEPTGAAQPALVDAINQVWEWSNLTIQKQRLCRLAATHGLCGLRIVARDDPDPARRRVYIKPEHPKVIRDMHQDDRGNIEAIELEYDLTVGLAEEAETITVRERLERDRIQTWRVENGQATAFDLMQFQADGMPGDKVSSYDGGPGADYPNALGVVPYVALYHELGDDEWGRNAFAKARAPIERVNGLICHTDIKVHQHVRATWLIAAAGAAPAEFVFDDMKVVYVNTAQSNSTPMAQAMVANLDLQGAIAQAKLQLDLIEDMLPELKATAGKFLSGQSGETIAELRKPAEEKVGLARANYEDALLRAQKIAVSWMVLLELADVGTGMGTREAAEQAYRGGFEDHRFNRRPLLVLGETGTAAQQPAQPQQGRTTEGNGAREGGAEEERARGNGVMAGRGV
jgi:hypothetical protein